MQLHFILVNPARGENVGFIARALKTLGFKSLRIVGEALQHSVPARKTGYGAHDLLDQVTTFALLEEAVADIDLTIGTTSKKRIKRYDGHAPYKVRQLLDAKKEMLAQVGLVFGSEENGLTTEQLDCCDLISTIPLTTDYPSLNLAQSALIYAWELRGDQQQHYNPIKPNLQLQNLLMNEVTALLDRLEVTQKPLLTRRIMDRVALLNTDDSRLLMNILTKLNRKE